MRASRAWRSSASSPCRRAWATPTPGPGAPPAPTGRRSGRPPRSTPRRRTPGAGAPPPAWPAAARALARGDVGGHLRELVVAQLWRVGRLVGLEVRRHGGQQVVAADPLGGGDRVQRLTGVQLALEVVRRGAEELGGARERVCG